MGTFAVSADKAYLKPIGKRLAMVRDERGFRNREQFAEAFGVPKKTFEKYEQGLTELPTKLMMWLRDAHRVNLTWLVTGEGDMFDDASKALSAPITVEQTDFQQFANTMVQKIGSLERKLDPPPPPPATIKFFPDGASAGWGRAVLDDTNVEELDMEAFASRLLGLDVDDITLFPVKGDSMYPTLQIGDYAVINRSKRKFVEGALFVVSIDNELYVKRAKRGEDGACCWLSDNIDQDKYPPICRQGDEISRLKVIGRVTNFFRSI